MLPNTHTKRGNENGLTWIFVRTHTHLLTNKWPYMYSRLYTYTFPYTYTHPIRKWSYNHECSNMHTHSFEIGPRECSTPSLYCTMMTLHRHTHTNRQRYRLKYLVVLLPVEEWWKVAWLIIQAPMTLKSVKIVINCMIICIYTHTYTNTYIPMHGKTERHLHINTCAQTCIHIHGETHTDVPRFTYMQTHTLTHQRDICTYTLTQTHVRGWL